jgi:phenylpropionate dioxygenase-like ring-hydroxylating dioxygenase large terminal subunit
MKSAENFRLSDWRMRAFRCEIWQGWIFANLDSSADSLAPQLLELAPLFERHESAEFAYINLGSYDIQVNWKCVVDIFAENYHTSGVHEVSLRDSVPSFRTIIDDTGNHPYCRFRLPSGSGAELTNPDDYLLTGGFKSPSGLTAEDRTHAIGGILFPTFSWYFNPDLFFYVEINPQTFDRTSGRYGIGISPEAKLDPNFNEKLESYRKNSQVIVDEDIWAVEQMQRGKRSAYAVQGRTSRIEGSLWFFHKWYIERMKAIAPELFDDFR